MSEDRHWRVEHLHADLKHRAVRSGASVIGAQIGNALVAALTMAILARLLRSSDFGVVAMAFPTVMSALALRNFGLDVGLLNRSEIDAGLVNAIFWMSLRFNFLLAAATAGSAFLWARFFGEPRLIPVMFAFAGGMFALCLGAVHEALLKRQMQFEKLSILSAVAGVCGAICAIVLALLGAGYWALVSQMIVPFLFRTVSLWIICDWRPRFSHSLGEKSGTVLRGILKSGFHLTSARALNISSNYLDRVMVGWHAGAVVLGLYDNGRRLAFFALDNLYAALVDVAVSGLSRAAESEARFRSSATRSIQLVLTLLLPALAFSFVEMRPITQLVLGERWLGAVPFARCLVVGAFAQSLSRTTIWFYFARDETARQLRWGAAQAVVVLIAVVLGNSLGGALGVAVAFAAASCLLAIPAVIYALGNSPFRAMDFAAAATRPVLLSIFAAAAAFFFSRMMNGESLGHLFVAAFFYLATYFGGWLVCPGGVALAREMAELFRRALARR